MKTILKQILKYYLKYIAKLVLWFHRPLIIGVSGSTNEIFTKNEIKHQLVEAELEVRSNPKNFNTEIGLPLAILNLPSGYNSYLAWLPIIGRAFTQLFYVKLPKILVLGLGISAPGDMKYLISLLRPKIAIITDITQRYVESFSDMDELVGEYEHFVKSLGQNDYLIINSDNPRVNRLAALTKAKIIHFGLNEIKNEGKNYWRGEVAAKTITGQAIRVNGEGETRIYQINRFGQHHIYALLAGLIVKKIVLNQ